MPNLTNFLPLMRGPFDLVGAYPKCGALIDRAACDAMAVDYRR